MNLHNLYSADWVEFQDCHSAAWHWLVRRALQNEMDVLTMAEEAGRLEADTPRAKWQKHRLASLREVYAIIKEIPHANAQGR